MKLTLHAKPMIRYWSYPFWSSMQKRASQDTLWIIPIRNLIVERSFSFRRRVHNWLHNSMPKRLLREIVVNFMFDYTFFIKYRYKQCLYDHPSSWVYRHFELMLDIWDICIFCRLLSLWYCYLLSQYYISISFYIHMGFTCCQQPSPNSRHPSTPIP